MQNIFRNMKRPLSPWMLIGLLVGYLLLALFLFNAIGLALVLPLLDNSIENVFQILSNPSGHENGKLAMLLLQGITALGAFVLTPLLFSKVYLNWPARKFMTISARHPLGILYCLLIMSSFMVVNSLFIDWNMNMEFPQWLEGFEKWAREKEDDLAEITRFLTEFDSIGYFLLCMVVIAVLAGIGEELVFRGLFQNLFYKALGNIHVSIWLTAFIFGAFHLQFYGVLPRMMLGALFGYLYYWSGHLGYAMIAHFANNAFMLTMVYLYQQGSIEFNMEATQASPEIWIVLIFVGLTSILLVNFYRLFNSNYE